MQFTAENARGAAFHAGTDSAGIAKELHVALDSVGTGVTVTHRLINNREAAMRVAPWALTIMKGGGTAIIPQEPYRAHADDFLPVRPLALWGYTDLSDPRWTFSSRYIRLHCDSRRADPQKIGALNKQEWCGYFSDGQLFVKRFPHVADASYPDFQSNNEVFTAGDFIELESLGPLKTIEPGGSCEHEERWSLHDVLLDESDESIDAAVTKINTSGAP